MSELKRYFLDCDLDVRFCTCELRESPDGEWVRYKDARAPAVPVEALRQYIAERRPTRKPGDSWTEGFRDGLAAVEIWLNDQARGGSE